MAFEALHFSRMFQIRQRFEVPPPVTPEDAVVQAFTRIEPELVSLKGKRVVRIKNTMDLETIVVSEAYLEELQCLDSIDIVGASSSLDIGAWGMMKEIS